CTSPLPSFEDVRVIMRGDTAIIEFTNVPAAADYRVYPMPEPSALGTDGEGRQTIRDAIYRCAGQRTVADREQEYGAAYAGSLVAADNGYARKEREAILGHVFLQPGPGRVPVYRLADPNGNGGYFNAEWIPPLYEEANSAEYVIAAERRAELLRLGFRDDGIAFYAPARGDRTVYRIEYTPDDHQGTRVSFYFTEGAEHDARTSGDQSRVLDLGARFSVLAAPASGSVPLHRVTYRSGSTFDVLAAGPAAYQRVLHQGGPVTSLTWSGLSEPTTLVIEALDVGCPFPGAYLGAFAAEPEDATDHRTDTLDGLRSPETGEVFVNGQHAESNRPAAIARSLVEVAPQQRPALDFEATFSDPDELAAMERHEDDNAIVFRNPRWSVETSHCGEGLSFGAVLGQLFLGLPRCRISVVPRGFSPRISATSFLHVRMASDLPSTGRRYPQLLITTAQSREASEVTTALELPIHERLGPAVASQLPGPESSIIVQTHFSYHEAQIQFCGHRGWGTTAFCPRANLYGFNAGEPEMRWTGERWLPVPVVGDRVGFDRPVQLDVYASTERVYLFIDDQPTGCAILPAGEMPTGDVSVAFGAVIDEPEKDEIIRGEPGRKFERELSLLHSDRRMDDFGIDLDVPAPAWDESVLPCATRWFGGRLIQE
ncbi:MAG TPA: hypothetical protein VK509_00890, partial [Polyangiales bacterium]|nr:hypothetical protein [Polyangiales bacterium]